jgi:hypothetical protein
MKRWPALAVGLALLLGMDALAAPAKAACASGHGCKAHMRTHKNWRPAFGAGRVRGSGFTPTPQVSPRELPIPTLPPRQFPPGVAPPSPFLPNNLPPTYLPQKL